MGLSPISFQEIDAYMKRCEIHLSGDEVLIIRKMSQAYVSNVQNKDPHAKPPFGEPKIIKNNSFAEALKGIARVVEI